MTGEIIIIAAVLIVTVNYCLLIHRLTTGLNRLKYHQQESGSGRLKDQEPGTRFVTVLIAARNEESSIGDCLKCLLLQDYPAEEYEVIIIDDQSTDATADLVKRAIAFNPRLIRLLTTNGTGGKKEAIRLGLLEAKGDIILTTDADCLVPTGWIREYNNSFNLTDAAFISGPVMMHTDRSYFSIFQALEFNSLIASTAGSAAIGRPVMSNGANMGFAADSYRQVSHLQSGNVIGAGKTDVMQKSKASGEDVFTMLSIKKHMGREKISFLYSPAAIVFTKPQSSVNDFIKQRIRWVSKSSGYKDFDVIYTALSVFAMNLILLALPVFLAVRAIPESQNLIVMKSAIVSFIAAFSLKMFVDYRLLCKYSGTMGQKAILWHLLWVEPVVIVYTSLTGILGNFLSFEWKGRTYRK